MGRPTQHRSAQGFTLGTDSRPQRELIGNLRPASGFTLIELLIVVAIITILAAIAVFNMREATERSLRASNAANYHTIAVALQSYVVDYNKMPPGDCEAGPFPSHMNSATMNAPAAGGSWSGVPWLLVDLKYISNPDTLFCPKYLRLYKGGKTLGNEHPRYHNFRYAYNAASVLQGGITGGGHNGASIMNGTVWIVRDLFLSPKDGFYAQQYPKYPADFNYPWGDKRDVEHVMYADMAVKLVKGGTNEPPPEDSAVK